ncbi:MAG: serine hydrolase [Lachnospiraceae bacterium]|nr:serine hydrolase [Lachnospiraceae bacterium]
MEVLKGKVDCLPEETGYDSSRIEALNAHFERLIDKEIILGAQYTISHKGKIIANASMGSGSRISQVKMQPDTVFPIASITKLFTTVALMQLIEDGYIRLNTAVAEILPQFAEPPFNGITLLHLLTHTSGLYPDGGCFPESAPKNSWGLIEEAAQLWNGEGEFDWVKAGISGGLRRPVGSEWQYNSFGFVLLGEVISKVSGQNVHDYITQKVIRPLAMQDTAFEPTQDMAKRMFIRNERQKEMLEAIIAGKALSEDTSFWSKIPSTGGGLCSTTNDLIRFANMMLNYGRLDGSRILGRKMVERITTQQLHNVPDYCWGANEPNRLYGIGFDMRQGPAYTYSDGTYMHEGAGASSIDIDPKEQLCAAWFVPWDKGEWCPDPLYNVQNIIWSGIM